VNAQMIIDTFCIVLAITAFWSFRAHVQRDHATQSILDRLAQLEESLNDLKKKIEEDRKA
jgi:hypothetical protein